METNSLGIYVTEHRLNNMTMQRIVVSNPAILEILKIVKLPVPDQERAVELLVDRTPDWLELSQEDQVAKIKMTLTTETVIYYLQCIETIKPKVDLVEVGIDEEGSVVVYAYYVDSNREQRRNMQKKVSKKKKEQMVEAVNILAGNDNLIDLAKAKLERMKKGKM